MATMPPTDSLHASTNLNESTINTGHGSAIQQQPSIVPFDAENPYYLHSSDGAGTTLVGNVLTGIDNYNPWARAMTMALKERNKFCFVDGSLPMPDVAHPDHARWHRVNNMVMSWILNSIHSSLANTVLYSTNAASAWTDLQERFSTANGPRIYEIEKRIATFSQRDASIADYHNHLSALWDELNQLVPPPKCSCSARHEYIAQMERRRLMQFLMGLRDTFAQPRSQLLLNVNLPTVKNAYSLLLQDESQRVQSEGHEHPVDHSALQAARIGIDAPAPLQSHISSMPQFTAAANQSSTNRAHASSSTSRPSNHRPRLRCAHCGILGHTQQVCYKLHGYPPGHKFYKKGNTNSQPITAQSTSPIPSESLQQLIRLLQEVKEPKANLVVDGSLVQTGADALADPVTEIVAETQMDALPMVAMESDEAGDRSDQRDLPAYTDAPVDVVAESQPAMMPLAAASGDADQVDVDSLSPANPVVGSDSHRIGGIRSVGAGLAPPRSYLDSVIGKDHGLPEGATATAPAV
nr:Retrovirus-related Pol polyprotein from transposon TNT 1-94 [Ipomoea batatas]